MQPDIQKRAREELDMVVGPDRLPTFEDYDALPYIQAIIMECLRWLPVTPMGPPHSTTRDDNYKGYFIPKGTVIMPVSKTLMDTFSIFLTESEHM
jgi:cytochrome P450